MMDDFNLYPLYVFQRIAEHGSVTRAAREMFVSQPAVSAHLRALEARYGAPLFERTPRGMRLTPAGTVLAEHANRLFALLEDIGAAIDAARGQVRGEVMIAASSTPAAYLLPALLRRFSEHFPDAEPTLTVGDSAQVLAWLHDYRVPLGVVGEAAAEDRLYREHIATDELRLVTAANDPLCEAAQIEEEHLRARTLLLRERGSSTRAGAEALLGELLPKFKRVEEVASAEVIKQAVAAGLGVSVLSSWATRLEETAGLLRPAQDARFRRERRFHLVRRADRQLVGAAAALWKFLKASSEENDHHSY